MFQELDGDFDYLYEGYWKNGMKNGYGRYIDNDGDTYEGEWLDDLRHGNGTETSTDGTSYKGEFKYG